MGYLILFFILSVGISFLCSILESALLSTQMSYISLLEKESPKVGKLLKSHKENINVSIASVLILNTIANTLGASAVGAQASHLFGDEAVIYVSIILTFAILYVSEIVPKTIGAIYWKPLAPFTAYMVKFFIFITYPIIKTTLFITDKISNRGREEPSTTKDELIASMQLSENEGVIDEKESDLIENVLKLDEVKVADILTPRSVVFALEENMSIKEVLETKDDIFSFSRVPIYKGTIDNVTGIVLTKQLFREFLRDESAILANIKKDIFSINENVPVAKALDLFIRKKEHMFLVTDSYDQTEGIVTLEDCVETILGIEIVDESDKADDMRELAKRLMRQKRRARDLKRRN
ncbi:MAG: HlyC/CorC family transporter [Epsilonproteobacteria bacterium]|nr:HlyC/CorC family transporter [Campylobacterota bacterium]